MSKKTSPTETLVLDYDLFELPTAQHKAGLAGLLIMIRSMQARRLTNIPELVRLTQDSVSIAFTKETLRAVFDDLYDATLVEVDSASKWQNVTPKRSYETETLDPKGKKKNQQRYVYNILQPLGAFLMTLYPDGDGPWLKLWREMLWGTLRSIPRTRVVYQERLEKKSCALGVKIWDGLVRSYEARKKGGIRTEGLASSIYVGAQDVNAEQVPFRGRVEHNLLLHFWSVVSLVFAPQVHSLDGKSSQAGYVIVIPEPSDLVSFLDDISDLLRSLETDTDGYRPKASLIDLPEEGGLEYLYHIARRRVGREDIAFSLAAVELYHLQKQGKSVRALTATRIIPNLSVLDLYEPLRKSCKNHLFKTLRLRNLLSGKRWHENSEDMFSRYPWKFFIFKSGDTPRWISFFGFDVRRTMASIELNLKTMGGGVTMTEQDLDDKMASRIYRLMRSYVNHKAEEKSGEKYKDFQGRKDEKGRVIYPEKYREARQKVCADAFLAMRSRREADFIDYFVGSICSVPHFLPEAEYLALSQALMADWNRVKNLAMLALSAHSYVGDERNQEKGDAA